MSLTPAGGDVSLHVTFFKNKKDTSTHNSRQMSWAELVGKLSTHQHTRSLQALESLASDQESLDSLIKQEKDRVGLFSPVRYLPDTRRAKANVETVTALVLDSDDGGALADAIAQLDGYEALIYTTHSHTPELPRFRVVIPLAAPLDVSSEEARQRYDRWYDAAGRRFLPGGHDANCKDTSRMHYLPGCPADMADHAEVYRLEGRWLDAAEIVVEEEQTLYKADTGAPQARPLSDDVRGLSAMPAYKQTERAALLAEYRPKTERSEPIMKLAGMYVTYKVPMEQFIEDVLAHPSGIGAKLYEDYRDHAQRVGYLKRTWKNAELKTRGHATTTRQQKSERSGTGSQEKTDQNGLQNEVEMLDGLPDIVCNGRQLRHIADEALDAIRASNVGNDPAIFTRGGGFCQLKPDEGNRLVIRDARPSDMIGILARTANWVIVKQNGSQTAVHPPRTVAEMLVAEQRIESFPRLDGVVMAPILDRSYNILTTPGYHPSTGAYYHEPSGQPLISAEVIPRGLHEVRSAVEKLVGPNGIFGEFPYADQASRANALAYLLTPFVRYLIEGQTPLHMFDAPTPGTGKTLLATSMASVFAPGVSVNTVPNTPEEWPKLLGAVLSGGSSHVIFDNAKGKVDNQALDAALTSWPLYEYRVLGVSDTRKIAPRCVWAMTTNNAHVSEDFARRCVTVRLDSRTERPDLRRFKRNIYEDIRDNRRRYVLACLTIIAHWADAQMAGGATHGGTANSDSGTASSEGATVMSSYPAYCQVLGGILEMAEVPGFLANVEETRRKAAPDAEILRAFFNATHERFGSDPWKAKQAFDALSEDQKEDLATIIPGKAEALAHNLGRKLGQHVDRIFDGLRLVKGGSRAGSLNYVLLKESASSAAQVALTAQAAPPVERQPSPPADEVLLDWECEEI
jgi:hypothetical protein